MAFTTSQQRALSVVPKVTGILSFLGSTCIVRAVSVDIVRRKANTPQRLLLGMSCLDAVTSLCMVLSTLPIPRGTPGVWAPMGNTETCTVQGFFMQWIVGVPLYNASLAVYSLLTSRFRWTEDQIRSVEPLMHGIALSVALGTSIAGIPLKLYNNAMLWCWIAPFPPGCKSTFRFGDKADCVRGDNAFIYRWAFTFSPAWLCILVAMMSMVFVYWAVLQQEKSVDKLQDDGKIRRTHSRRIAWQAFWYTLSFYIAWIPSTVTRLLQSIPATDINISFPLVLFMSICIPLQGFLNFMVFFRSKYLKHRRDHPGQPLIRAILIVAFTSSTEEPDAPLDSDPGLPHLPSDITPAEHRTSRHIE